MATQFFEDQFSRRPRADQMPVRYEMERVPPGGFHGIIILSGDVLGVDVHYDQGKTRPCLAEECEVNHNVKLPFWRGYLFAWKPRQQEIFCVEVTPAAMSPLDEAFHLYRSLRGCKVNLVRIPEKAQGRMKCNVFAPAKDLNSLPDAPSLRKYLCRVWQMKYVEERQIVTDEMLKSRSAADILAMNGQRPA